MLSWGQPPGVVKIWERRKWEGGEWPLSPKFSQTKKVVERNISPHLSCFPIAPPLWDQAGAPQMGHKVGDELGSLSHPPYPCHFSSLLRFSISLWASVLC